MTQEALKLALDALETELSIDWTNNDEFNASAEKMYEAIAAIKEALTKEKTLQALHSENERLGLYEEAYAQPEQEPVAWRTFDGEGGYDYRSYEDNESYADDWNKRNPNHVGWVDKLYTHSQPEQEPVATVEDNSQQWKGMDGAIAFHLIERHADNWSDARKMMEEWLSANTTSPPRTWIGLEGEEIRNSWEEATKPDRSTMTMVTSFARAIEAKLKERNT